MMISREFLCVYTYSTTYPISGKKKWHDIGDNMKKARSNARQREFTGKLKYAQFKHVCL